jgi:3-oxoacyl-(acyl-carrier-protein) synthase
MKHRRVKITGIGPVTPAGIGREAFMRGIFEPVSRVGIWAPAGESKGASVAAALVNDFRVGAFALDAEHLTSPRHVQFALAATVLALRDAGLTLVDMRKKKPLVVVSRPSIDRTSWSGPVELVSPDKATSHLMQEAVARLVGGQAGDAGYGNSFSSLDAIGSAAMRVASGEVDLAICGGADAPINEKILSELKKLGLSPNHANAPEHLCRPFDLWRTTGVAGEGACMFVLEAEESPRRAHARVAGTASKRESDNRPWEALGEAVRLCLGNAGLRPSAIDCIHADGIGHKGLDLAEAVALGAGFGTRLASIPVVSIKGAVGNALGAAGAIQVGCAALGMRHSMIAPTVNWRHPDPSCLLNLSASPRLLAMGTALVVGRDLAGSVSCLILKQ